MFGQVDFMDSKGRFLKIICSRCKNDQVVFGKASTRVKCVKCNKLLVKNGGGKAQVKTLISEVL